MVERDLPKVDVEGSKPFSRSKINGSLMGSIYFILWIGREPEKRVRQNLTYARSAKRQILRLTREQRVQARRV